uniref:Uncharacterized protein n=1 Tax=Glossina morsitans morsitans TaxID=37546 RepID=A0A1B0G2U0_GLOMM
MGGGEGGQYQELVEKAASGTVENVMKTCAYLWYAQELNFVQAAEVLTAAMSVESIPSTFVAAAAVSPKAVGINQAEVPRQQ